MTAPAWLPDWRDAASYPARRSGKDWHWQFLRRRSDYQQDWRKHSRKDRQSDRAEMPGCLEKYGRFVLWNPAREQAPWHWVGSPQAPYGVNFAAPEVFARFAERGEYLMLFDLKRPLAPQVRKAKTMLEDVQRELYGRPSERRAHRSKWPLYLRLLDAKASGASLAEIARGIGLAAEGDSAVDLKARVHELLDAARRVQISLTS